MALYSTFEVRYFHRVPFEEQGHVYDGPLEYDPDRLQYVVLSVPS